MFNTHYLGQIKKQFWLTMDDHIGARVVFKFFFPLMKKNAKRIMDAWAMVHWLVLHDETINGASRERLKELANHLKKSLPSDPKKKDVIIRHGYPPEIFDYELDENTSYE